MAKKKNFFGIKKGEHPETKETVINQLIEAPWDIAKHYVLGVPGAEYSGFVTREEAEAYLGMGDQTPAAEKSDAVDRSHTASSHQPNVLYCYVDGSYNKEIPNYGFGAVFVKNGEVVGFDKGAGTNKEAIEMYQIGGELLGAMKSLMYAKKHGEKEVVIFHDYLGVGHHATGAWKRKTEFSKVYYEWMQKFFREHPEIKVDFSKVDAHTGDDFNEIADGLAKQSVGLDPNSIYFKMAEKHNVTTK